MRGWGATKPPAGLPLDVQHPLAQGLLHYWPLVEGAGRRVVDLAGGNDLIFGASAAWNAGAYGPTLRTLASNDASLASTERFADEPAMPAGALYVLLAHDAVPQVTWGSLSTRAGAGTGGLLYPAAGVAGYNWADASTTYNWNSGLAVVVDRWHHILVSVTPAAGTLYVDGASAVNAVTHSTFTPNTAAWNLGGDPFFNSRTVPARIACAAIWTRALTAFEVQTLFAAPFDLVWYPRSWWAATIPPAQTATPASDVSAGTWTTDTGATTTLYAAIDEATANDADYVQSQAGPTGNSLEVALSSLADPAASTGHTVRVRAQLGAVTGGALSLTTEVRQGASALSTPATWTDTLTTSVQTFTHTLSGAQADAITNYGTLRLLFTADQAAGAAPTFVAASALAVTATNGATFAPAIPAGTNGQDILLLGIFRSDNSAPTAPGGSWTALTALNGVNSSTTIQSTYWYWMVAAGTIGSGTSTTAPTITYGTSTVLRGGRMYAIRGADTTTPFATVSGGGPAYTRLNNVHQAAGSASATTTTDLTPLETNVRGLVVAVAYGLRVTATETNSTGWAATDLLSTTTGNDATVTVSNKGFTTPAALGAPTISTATTTTAGVSTGFLFAFQPIVKASRARVTWAQLEVPAAAAVAGKTPYVPTMAYTRI